MDTLHDEDHSRKENSEILIDTTLIKKSSSRSVLPISRVTKVAKLCLEKRTVTKNAALLIAELTTQFTKHLTTIAADVALTESNVRAINDVGLPFSFVTNEEVLKTLLFPNVTEDATSSHGQKRLLDQCIESNTISNRSEDVNEQLSTENDFTGNSIGDTKRHIKSSKAKVHTKNTLDRYFGSV